MALITLPDGSTRPLTWRRQPLDHRDHIWRPTDAHRLMAAGPGPYGNEAHCPAVDDQGQESDCTADGSNGLFGFTLNKNGQPYHKTARQHTYWHERIMDGSPTSQDGGSFARTAAKVLNQIGVCKEELMPYVAAQYATAPSAAAEADAPNQKLLQYAAVNQTQADIMAVFAAGQGLISGFVVTQSYESAQAMQTGIIPMPSGSLLGGHLTFFYDCDAQYVYQQGSWGTGIGVNGSGRFRMPWAYFLNPKYNSDIWTFVTVQENVQPAPPTPTPNTVPTLRDVSSHVTVRPDGSVYATVTAQDATSGHNYSGGTSLA